MTVTVNAHSLVLPEASVATQFTMVIPFGKVEPDGGVHTTVIPEQLSVAVAVKVTLEAEHWPGSDERTIFAGQVIVGFCLSTTVTVNEQLAPVVVVQLTIVAPIGKNEPLVGTQVTGPQLLVVGVG